MADKYFAKVRKQFRDKNSGLDNRDKWGVYEAVKHLVKIPPMIKIIRQPDEVNRLGPIIRKLNRFCIKGNTGERSNRVLLIRREADNFYDVMHEEKYTSFELRNKILKLLKDTHLVMIQEWIGEELPIDYKTIVHKNKILFYTVYQRVDNDTVCHFYDAEWKWVDMSTLFTSYGSLVYIKPAQSNNAALIPSEENRIKLKNMVRSVYKKFGKPPLLRVDCFFHENEPFFCEIEIVPGIFSNSVLTSVLKDKLLS